MLHKMLIRKLDQVQEVKRKAIEEERGIRMMLEELEGLTLAADKTERGSNKYTANTLFAERDILRDQQAEDYSADRLFSAKEPLPGYSKAEGGTYQQERAQQAAVSPSGRKSPDREQMARGMRPTGEGHDRMGVLANMTPGRKWGEPGNYEEI